MLHRMHAKAERHKIRNDPPQRLQKSAFLFLGNIFIFQIGKIGRKIDIHPQAAVLVIRIRMILIGFNAAPVLFQRLYLLPLCAPSLRCCSSCPVPSVLKLKPEQK